MASSPNPHESPQTGGILATAENAAPSRVRFGVLAFAVSMAVLLYLDRYAISVATPAIMAELQLSKTQMGWAVSAFFWAYALAQVPAGALADRWGGRLTLTVFVVGWSVVVATLGFAYGLATLVAGRLLLGLTQAGAYSTTAGMLKHWIPLAHRGKANGAVSMGGRTGGLLAPALTPLLMLLVAQLLGWTSGLWRPVFVAYGALGLVWAWFFWRWFRNTPAEHADCNGAERTMIDPTAAAHSSFDGKDGGIALATPWKAILTSRNVLLLGLVNFSVNVGWIFLSTWLPTYLKEVHRIDLVKAGALTAITGLAGMAGCLCGGWATDRLVRRFGLVWGRRWPGLLSACGAAIAYLACLAIALLPGEAALAVDASGTTTVGFGSARTLAIVGLLASVYFLADLFLGTTWSTYQDIGGPHVATVLGFANMCGNLGAAIFAAVIGVLAESGQWSAVFAVSAAAFGVAMGCWFFIDPRVPIELPAGDTPKVGAA